MPRSYTIRKRPSHSARRSILALSLVLGANSPLLAAEAKLDPALLAGMKARSIGPAGMSGRVADIAVVKGSPDTIYVGAATGGVWKSVNGGLSFTPIFDDQPVAAIGAVAVHPTHEDIVWVGTGEGNPRNSASVGDGIYRSLDGGRTWTHLGLAKTERIHRIRLHPTDPETAYVAALGPTWGDHADRGVFKTVDGGKTWSKILFVNDRTGAADMEMDPVNPKTLIVAMWEHRRWPWTFESGGKGSGLYITHDGGASFDRVGVLDGLPKGDLGRIGLAIAPSDPRIVYALIEAEKNGIYRSNDGGAKWNKVTEDGPFGNRPFYFADLRVDPLNPERVYSLWSQVSVSNDGGKSWQILVKWADVHPDHHAMWIDPEDPTHIWNGNDGGIAESRDHGKTWRFVSNLPLAQFYHIAVDDDTPYNVYGGMQDNGSWRGPSEVWENGGIRNHHWEEVGFGDGFDTRPEPTDSMRGYSMSQEGFLMRWDLRTGERTAIRPPAPDPHTPLRFNWNAGLALDAFVQGKLYYGSQFVHVSTDRGASWSLLSSDLTTDNPAWQKQAESGGLTLDVTGAENFTTIVTIAPSPLERDVLWVGTDDGRVHVTTDGGGSWDSVEKGLKGARPNTWVPQIVPSSHRADVAYVVLDDHRRSSWVPYVYRATEFGKKFERLADEDDLTGYALCVAEDPRDPDLLFVGTEFGLWVTVDGGDRWMKWTHGVPTVSVMDMAVQAREDDLVIGTHGRAAFILDDIAPLRGLTAKTLEEPLHLFAIPDAQQYRVKQTGASRFPAHGEYRGKNAAYGALITVSLNQEGLPHPDDDVERKRREAERMAPPSEPHDDEQNEDSDDEGGERDPAEKLEVRITDRHDRPVRRFERKAHLGVNRLVWDLRRDAMKQLPREDPDDDDEPTGPEVLPGVYHVTVELGGHEQRKDVTVRADPRFEIAMEARERRDRAVIRAAGLREIAALAIERINATIADIDVAVRKAKAVEEERRLERRRGGQAEPEKGADKSAEAALLDEAKAITKRLRKLEEELWFRPQTKGIRAETPAIAPIGIAEWFLGSSWDAPTPAQLAYLAAAEHRLEVAIEEVNGVFEREVDEFRKAVEEAELELLPRVEPLTME